MTSIAVIGAGFSGTLLSLHLLRRCPNLTEVHLIERNSSFGRGAAYATGNPNHLLNVPAGRMSAFHDRPRDFLEWLIAETAGRPDCDGPGELPTEWTFVSRHRFGTYIRNLLSQEMRDPANAGRLKLVRGDVTHVEADTGRLVLCLDRERRLETDLAVLATGNFPPTAPPGATAEFMASRVYRADPWAPDALADLDCDAPVLLIGTGLTMVDTVVTLLDRGHRGPIQALSRRGLLPLRHARASGPPVARHGSFPTRLTALARYMRLETRRAKTLGAGWQPVVDELRPFTQDVWLEFSHEDRQRFLRHIRPWWDVHRHRMAPAVADRIDGAREAGQFRIHAGRIRHLGLGPQGAVVHFDRRVTGEPAMLEAQRVINCAGPGADYDRISHPLIRSLLCSGLVRPDPLRLGLDVTANCALKDAEGAISRRFFAVGPVTKGTFWEMTAVPDIRRQCEFLATHLSLLVKPPPPVPVPEFRSRLRADFKFDRDEANAR
jgi:uncharacterized NAD(P)/FAD-binding protein YdhS